MTASLFDVIRARSAQVADTARWVSIDMQRLARYPETLQLNPNPMTHSADHHLLGRGDDTLIYFIILDSINFGSGYFPFLDKQAGLSGYFTVAQHLKAQCERHGVPSAEQLAQITPDQCRRWFQQRAGNNHSDELMGLFASALNSLGRWVSERHDGDCLGLLRTGTTAAEVVERLTEMPFYNDVARYRDFEVPFLKRAQLLVQDLALAEPDHPLVHFSDIDSLTIFADNVLPYVLHADGVLRYDPWLADRIQRGELIGAGSTEEVELRACSIHAVECLHQMLRDEVQVAVRRLDYVLWNRGQVLKRLIGGKRHRTRCVYY